MVNFVEFNLRMCNFQSKILPILTLFSHPFFQRKNQRKKSSFTDRANITKLNSTKISSTKISSLVICKLVIYIN